MISSIPNYFNNSETPIICEKYNKPFMSTIFNFNEILTDIDIQSNLDYSKCQGPQESFRIIGSSNDRNREFLDIFGKAWMLS